MPDYPHIKPKSQEKPVTLAMISPRIDLELPLIYSNGLNKVPQPRGVMQEYQSDLRVSLASTKHSTALHPGTTDVEVEEPSSDEGRGAGGAGAGSSNQADGIGNAHLEMPEEIMAKIITSIPHCNTQRKLITNLSATNKAMRAHLEAEAAKYKTLAQRLDEIGLAIPSIVNTECKMTAHTMLARAWSKAGFPKKAQNALNAAIELHRRYEGKHCYPHYSIVITLAKAMLEANKENSEGAREIFKKAKTMADGEDFLSQKAKSYALIAQAQASAGFIKDAKTTLDEIATMGFFEEMDPICHAYVYLKYLEAQAMVGDFGSAIKVSISEIIAHNDRIQLLCFIAQQQALVESKEGIEAAKKTLKMARTEVNEETTLIPLVTLALAQVGIADKETAQAFLAKVKEKDLIARKISRLPLLFDRPAINIDDVILCALTTVKMNDYQSPLNLGHLVVYLQGSKHLETAIRDLVRHCLGTNC